jgi:hypothetical protein
VWKQAGSHCRAGPRKTHETHDSVEQAAWCLGSASSRHAPHGGCWRWDDSKAAVERMMTAAGA